MLYAGKSLFHEKPSIPFAKKDISQPRLKRSHILTEKEDSVILEFAAKNAKKIFPSLSPSPFGIHGPP